MTTSDLAYKQLYPLQYLHKFLAQGIRPDGRSFTQSRPVTLQHDIITNADASCLATVGTTTCIASVFLQIVQPADSMPNQGVVDVSAEMPPMCCPLLASSRLTEHAAVLAHRLGQVVTACIDSTQLVIASGTAVWKIKVQVCVLDSSGSVLDAALLAVMASLQHCPLPAVDLPTGNKQSKPQINTAKPSTALKCTPAVACSMVWVPGMDSGDGAPPAPVLLIDPDQHEQGLAAGDAVVITREDGSLLHAYYCCNGNGSTVSELTALANTAAAERLAALAGG